MELEKENQKVGEQGVSYEEKTMTNTHSASLFESYIMYLFIFPYAEGKNLCSTTTSLLIN